MKLALIMSHFRDEETEVLRDEVEYLNSHFVNISVTALLKNNINIELTGPGVFSCSVLSNSLLPHRL